MPILFYLSGVACLVLLSANTPLLLITRAGLFYKTCKIIGGIVKTELPLYTMLKKDISAVVLLRFLVAIDLLARAS